jgi:DNA-binding NtrC family response regulator
LSALSRYDWPGNIRELENLVERLAVLSESEIIDASELPDHIVETRRVASIEVEDVTLPESGVDFNALIEDYENKLISSALAQTGGNKKAAAKLLGLNRTTLVEKIKKKGLESRIEVTITPDTFAM